MQVQTDVMQSEKDVNTLSAPKKSMPQYLYCAGVMGTLVALAVLAGWRMNGVRGMVLATGVAFLMLISWVDWRQWIIPNSLLVPGALLILGLRAWFAPASLPGSIAGGMLGWMIFWFIAQLADGDLGGGDVRLAGFIGLLTGVAWVIPALLAGMLLGGLIAFWLTASGHSRLDEGFPYGPALSLGAVLMLFVAMM